MAVGVNRSPKKPSGPWREIRENTKSPTTTVGRERSVLKKVMVRRRPRNCSVPTAKPNGTPTREARSVAVLETKRVRKVMEKTSLSKEKINRNALRKPSDINSIEIMRKRAQDWTFGYYLYIFVIIMSNFP
jgi:hypothetical protein